QQNQLSAMVLTFDTEENSKQKIQGAMLMPTYFLLLLLLLLGAPGTSLSHKFYNAGPVFSCLNTALSEVKNNKLEDVPSLSKKSFDHLPPQDPLGEEEEQKHGKRKRTFSGAAGGSGAGGTRYRYQSQAQHKGKLYQDKAKSDRGTKFTLSLDVPTNIMNILFNIDKAKNLRAKAAANAQLMAHIGKNNSKRN
ncbi:urocortin-3-like protein, partial [Cricetulus griseus]